MRPSSSRRPSTFRHPHPPRPSSRSRRACPTARLVLAALLAAWLAPSPAAALEWWDGRLEVHGFTEVQLRWLSDGFDANNWYQSQWAHVLNLELEADLAPDGFGPFDLVSAFARVEVRYDCIFTGCGIGGSHQHFGDRASRAPARNWRDGYSTGLAGDTVFEPQERIHQGHSDLLTIRSSPLLDPIVALGGTNLEPTLAPVDEDLFAFKKFDETREPGEILLGPWRPESEIVANGALRGVPNVTSPLPMRPAIPNDLGGGNRRAQGLYVPSAPLREHLGEYDSFDQNFSQSELEWNHGAGQDEHELKELYLDLEMFDSRLWMRIGKQNIVWGKTELFRTTDQLNPQDFGISSLPSLEESRLALWSVRAMWSFWNVGPLQDVRLELAVNLDDFEPVDAGRCGEPYAPWLVCAKSAGLWAHGVLGVGLGGEIKPPDPWDDVKGLEVGGRLEWRWDRFSFALTDFWGYADFPSVEGIHFYERRVDPRTGRPLDVEGRPLTASRARDYHTGNRQFFDFVCSATVGVADTLIPGLEDVCLLDLLNDPNPLGLGPPGLDPSPAQALSLVLGGNPGGELVAHALLTGEFAAPPERLVDLNVDPMDGTGSVPFILAPGLSGLLTQEQEALLGCGPFYGTDCDSDGIDLFNAEASVLLQSFPLLGADIPAGTRFVGDELMILPGARGPGDPGYDPNVDGTPPPGFDSEMAALSENVARLLAILGISSGEDPDCSLDDLVSCDTVRAVLAVTSVGRPELRASGNGRFGRRDFIWHAGGEAQLIYDRRNVLGLSMDVAEDWTKTNWSMEFTWFDDTLFADNSSRSQLQEGDSFNLTVSVDRPTFIRFLNSSRTFFFNAQLFLGYLADWDRSYTTNGPLNVLWTLSASTGYFQDRLLPSVVWIHDLHSASGGVLPQVTWRFSQAFSATFGAAIFYGGPQNQDVALFPLGLGNRGGDFRARTRYAGLSPIAERDELFLRIRYTF